MVSLTGSVEGGVAVMRAAADNITKVSLELGGKAPAIVMQDADLDLAVKSIRASRIINTGQVCNCAERVYVQESDRRSIYCTDDGRRCDNTVVGDPFAKETEMGPMVSRAQMRVGRQGRRDGSRGRRRARSAAEKAYQTATDYFYSPTVLTHCRQETQSCSRRSSARCCPSPPSKTWMKPLKMANDCEYGLTSSIYTRSLDVAMRASNEMKFGETYVNRENFEAMQGFHAGWRKSGIGGADGKHGLEEYLQTHVVYMNYDWKNKASS